MNINQSGEFRQVVVSSGGTFSSFVCKAVLVFGIVGGSPVLHTVSLHPGRPAAASERWPVRFDGGFANAGTASFAATPSLDGERLESSFGPMFARHAGCNDGDRLTASSVRGFRGSLLPMPMGGVDEALDGSRAARLLGGLVTCSHRLPMSLDATSRM